MAGRQAVDQIAASQFRRKCHGGVHTPVGLSRYSLLTGSGPSYMDNHDPLQKTESSLSKPAGTVRTITAVISPPPERSQDPQRPATRFHTLFAMWPRTPGTPAAFPRSLSTQREQWNPARSEGRFLALSGKPSFTIHSETGQVCIRPTAEGRAGMMYCPTQQRQIRSRRAAPASRGQYSYRLSMLIAPSESVR